MPPAQVVDGSGLEPVGIGQRIDGDHTSTSGRRQARW
jgi:hypothetical protein